MVLITVYVTIKIKISSCVRGYYVSIQGYMSTHKQRGTWNSQILLTGMVYNYVWRIACKITRHLFYQGISLKNIFPIVLCTLSYTVIMLFSWYIYSREVFDLSRTIYELKIFSSKFIFFNFIISNYSKLHSYVDAYVSNKLSHNLTMKQLSWTTIVHNRN